MLKGIAAITGCAVVALGVFAVAYTQIPAVAYAQTATATPEASSAMTETMQMTETEAMTDDMGAEVEEAMEMSAVPHIVSHVAMMAAEQYLPGATMDMAGVQFDPEGEPAYEFPGMSAEGMEIEVDVLPNGMVQEIEEVIADTDVPAEAMALLNTLFPEATVDLIELSTRPHHYGLTQYYYEFEITTVDGVAYDVEVNEAGTFLTVEVTE